MPTESEVRSYWDRKARELGDDARATMKDVVLRGMELRAISTRLREDDTLLDVGCGNAYGSLILAERCRSVLAVDYSDEMIAAARGAIAASGRRNVSAELADVLNLAASEVGLFTAVSSIRCLINLPEEEKQYRGLDQLVDAVSPGGRLFLIEGIAEGFAAMNALRSDAGLPEIALNWHNRLFSRPALEAFLRQRLVIEETVDFGEYYFLSRVVHPLVVAPDAPSFDSTLNRVASTLWQQGVARGRFADISTLVLYVCRKP